MNPAQVSMSGERTVVITRGFDAPRALVFECHTRPALVRRWLLGPPGWTMPVCEIDLRVGGKYRFVWAHPEHGEMGMGGTYREVVRPERYASTELFDEDWTGGETDVTTEFLEDGARTTTRVTIVYASSEARARALATGMTEGMEQGYRRLDTVLVEEAAAGAG
jgi:uncharacterized protein YndB with AHSA1/START domain